MVILMRAEGRDRDVALGRRSQAMCVYGAK
jgi:hypothetical protein